MKSKVLVQISFIVVILLSLYPKLNAQNPKESISVNSLALDINALESLGFSYELLLNKRLALQVNAGFLGSGIGLQGYINEPRKQQLNVAAGIRAGYSYPPNYFFGDHMVLQAPLTLSYVTKNNFEFGLNFGLGYAVNYVDTPGVELSIGNGFFLNGGITVGYRFGRDIGESYEKSPTELRNIWGMNAGTMGATYGLFYERLLSPYLGIDARIGVIGGSIGFNVYVTGLSGNRLGVTTGAHIGNGMYQGKTAYLPIGLHYMSRQKGFLEITGGPEYVFDTEDYVVGFALKGGRVF
jgi:hypothetical protein